MGIQTALKLDAGPHDEAFLGWLCVNEAAIMAAGYKFRAIYQPEDLPRSFSRVIGGAAMGLNDTMSDVLRQKLLSPFITRLAYTRDTPEVEQLRASFMMMQFVRLIVRRFCEQKFKRLPELAVACGDITCFNDAIEVLSAIHMEARERKNSTMEFVATVALSVLNDSCMHSAEEVGSDFANAIEQVSGCGSQEAIYTLACDILHSTINIGKHREIKTSKAYARLSAIKKQAAPRTKDEIVMSWNPPTNRGKLVQGPDEIAAGPKRITELNRSMGVEDENGLPTEKQVVDALYAQLLKAA